ncbi:hypothetical protein BX600DRAFT_430271 [Xylariales sp. PMI_506]|nr:hypothetical protein BX600DRAFT_430271 [Xylariales sp. PMI_506]
MTPADLQKGGKLGSRTGRQVGDGKRAMGLTGATGQHTPPWMTLLCDAITNRNALCLSNPQNRGNSLLGIGATQIKSVPFMAVLSLVLHVICTSGGGGRSMQPTSARHPAKMQHSALTSHTESYAREGFPRTAAPVLGATAPIPDSGISKPERAAPHLWHKCVGIATWS